ncbi:hypothetical protein FKR81_20435 [Lentzea tibetensis]|uniref:OmpR/PhoB-type domain-containing protein n=1 Tax=Lentzea tibetensis TaxID=2591470 RepID=A0A563ESU9_9PSEU|nr:hypothetical protein FKR81_20435 [Lentzea tibetensis]
MRRLDGDADSLHGEPRRCSTACADEVVSRAELIDAVWGEAVLASAVYTYVSSLRRALEPMGGQALSAL